jgi:hypothetical protein
MYRYCLGCGGALDGHEAVTGLHAAQQPAVVWPRDPQHIIDAVERGTLPPIRLLQGRPRSCEVAYRAWVAGREENPMIEAWLRKIDDVAEHGDPAGCGGAGPW